MTTTILTFQISVKMAIPLQYIKGSERNEHNNQNKSSPFSGSNAHSGNTMDENENCIKKFVAAAVIIMIITMIIALVLVLNPRGKSKSQ